MTLWVLTTAIDLKLLGFTLNFSTRSALSAKGLSYVYPYTNQGIEGIDLELKAGTLTVITGRVGSGKTTLLRTLLGLLPKDSGGIYWNDERVADPATFFTPPHCGYTPQVPQLFSESLREIIVMGLNEDKVDLKKAIQMAVMEKDIEALDNGLETIVGLEVQNSLVANANAVRLHECLYVILSCWCLMIYPVL
jgi:ATP-binding cassette subfamily B protein